jgi:predicted outer membrane repeat protein
MHELTIVGYHSTLTRAQDAGSFSLLTVGCGSGDLKVINVNFTDGGGNDGYGGAIENDGGTLHVEGGIFSDNEAGAYGGAIYNDGDMTVSNATFTHNDAEYGGAIYNEDEASVDGSSFTSNGSPYSNYYGGAIYNDDDLDIAYSGFVANSTGDYGGAIYTEYYLDASHITVTANAAGSDGGGGIYNDDETATVSDYSVVVGNRPDNCYDVSGCGF